MVIILHNLADVNGIILYYRMFLEYFMEKLTISIGTLKNAGNKRYIEEYSVIPSFRAVKRQPQAELACGYSLLV